MPEGCNPDSKYRYYTKEQMLTLSIIRKLKFLGLSLKDIKSIVYESSTETFEKKINERLDEIQKMIDELREKQVEGKFLLCQLQEGRSLLDCYSDGVSNESENETKEINLEYIPEIDVIFTRRIQRDYTNVEVSLDRWLEVFRMASGYKVKITN